MKINEIFFSIQGEGLHIGLPTVFVRLFACDLRCSWCDTMYAVEGKDFREIPLEQVTSAVGRYSCKRVCITGGEPLIQKKDVTRLTEALVDDDYTVVLETSGHKEPPGIFFTDSCLISMDCKCPGSGMHEKMDFSLFTKLKSKDQLKFVIGDENDYEYALNVLKNTCIDASIIFQPVYGNRLGWLTEKVMESGNDKIRVLPQLHKLIWGEKRGV